MRRKNRLKSEITSRSTLQFNRKMIMGSLTLESSDGQRFEIDRDTVKYIGMINDMLQNLGDDELATDDPIKLSGVDSFMMDKVLKWARHCKREEQDQDKEKNFETDFIRENNDHLFELINTANFLDFQDMLQSLARSVAMRMKNKTPDELRAEFNIP